MVLEPSGLLPTHTFPLPVSVFMKDEHMKFNFSSGITLTCGQYEPALKFKYRAAKRICANRYRTYPIRGLHEI